MRRCRERKKRRKKEATVKGRKEAVKRVQRGSCGPVLGEPRLPRPFESAGLLGALVGAPKAPVGVESGLCGPWAAPRRHFGGRNHAFGSQHGTCASEGPSGLTLLPPTSSLLHSLCSRGRWAGAGCVPLGHTHVL